MTEPFKSRLNAAILAVDDLLASLEPGEALDDLVLRLAALGQDIEDYAKQPARSAA